MEEELQKSESRFRNLVETTSDWVWEVDENAVYTYASPQIYHILGYRPEEVIGKTPFDFMSPEEAKRVAGIFGPIISAKKPITNLENTNLHKDGHPVVLETSGVPVIGIDGKLRGYRGIDRDITERKRTEEAIRKSNVELSLFRSLLDKSNDAVEVIAPVSLRFLDVNETACLDLGYSREELLSMSIFDIDTVDPDTAKGIGEQIQKSGTLRFEGIHRRKDGSTFPVEISSSLVNLDKPYVLNTVRDITERKRNEAETERLLKETERINKELNDFAYIVSHDLKAPLRAVTQLAEWLNEDYADTLDDAGKETLKLLKNRTVRMHNMIEGILQYSRAGRMKGEPQKVDTGMAVRHVIDSLSSPENICLSIQDGLPQIDIDPLQINQVFQNLISNAVKYIDKPEGLIEVGCTDTGEFHEFFVKDNGPGIEERHFERIFQIFQTLTPKDEFESTGIGLTIVKKIIEQNGGRVWVESEVGKGSTFKFTLPKSITPLTSSPPL